MSARVDVLAILDDLIEHANLRIGERQALRDSRSAVSALIAERDALREALREAISLAWIPDSHSVTFDSTVMFGQGYDFSGLDGCRREEFHGQVECIVWPGTKWSAYCTHEGSMWFEKFDSAAEAKEACMRLLDSVLPDHPAMKARAALALTTGESA